jgi:rhodanese-related sulfurtransferase
MPHKDPREPFARITVQEAKEMVERGDVQVIDVREPNEYREGHVPGAKLMPVNSVLSRVQELNHQQDIVFICAVGQRSALACEMAAAMGLERLYNVEGGTNAWVEAGLPAES